MAVAEDVANHVVNIEVGTVAVAHQPGLIEGVVGNVAYHLLTACCGLLGLLRKDVLGGGLGTVDLSEGVFNHLEDSRFVDVARNGEDGVGGVIVAVEKVTHIVEGGILDMLDVGADGTPAVGVDLVAEWPQQHPHVAIGLVHVALVVLFRHHAFLHVKHRPAVALDAARIAWGATPGLLGDAIPPVALHAVGFEEEGWFEVLGGHGDIIISIIIISKGVALAAEFVHHAVEIGVLACAAEHQMLKEMREARVVRPLVPRPHAIEQVDCHQRRRAVPMQQHPQPIVQNMSLIVYHI